MSATDTTYTCPDYAAIESQQDARRYSDMLDADERRSRAEFEMAADFLRACGKADANAVVTWAPHITDWKGPLHLVGDKHVLPKRCQTLAECMGDTLDYTDGPASIELYQLLLNAAAGADVQAQANELLGRMAVVFAKFNAEAA